MLVVAQPTRGLDVGAIETVHAYLRDAAASGVAVLLISEDLDEIRALADRSSSCTRARSSASSTPGAPRSRRSGSSWPEGRELMARATARRSRGGCRSPCPSGRSSSPSRSWPSSSLRPGTTRARRIGRSSRPASRATGRSRRRSISATPILFTGLAAAAAFRMQLFNIGAEGQLYLGAVGASWIALQLGDRDVDVDAALRRRHVRGGGSRSARSGR